MFDLQIIRADATHGAALAETERIMDIPNRSDADTERLELLGFLISRYEEEILSGDLPDPIESIEAMMETRGMMRRDLAPTIGNRATARFVLNRRRALSEEMIRRLAEIVNLVSTGKPIEALMATTLCPCERGEAPMSGPVLRRYWSQRIFGVSPN